MTDKVIVLTTSGNESEAKTIARELVERQLAACVNIVPRTQSIYRWEGNVESAEEFLLIIKTMKARTAEVQSLIRELHSYELPEFIVLSIETGTAEYLKWIEDSVGWEASS
jgi:periplasmic divalent cation tolerance protein